MSELNFEAELERLRLRIDPLGRLVHALARSLPAPLRYDSGKLHHGFRYGKPNVAHFCLLKAARVVSALNAALELARCGYAQEISVLIRTLVQYTTHIEFVLDARYQPGQLDPAAEKYVQDYFADFARNSAEDFKRAQVKQNTVNKRLGQTLDSFAQQSDDEFKDIPRERLYSDVYLTFSNYVHAKYPEVMDMYGGTLAHFHLRGMKGTPKDAENLEWLDTFVTTASITFRLMVSTLKLHDLVEGDEVLADWFRSF
jgi:hypothetical protein